MSQNMDINAGQLNQRIAFLIIQRTEDPDGYETTRETEVYRCWASFSRTSGTEALRRTADFSQVKARFLIRWPGPILTRDMVVRYRGEDYEIEYLNDYRDAHRYMEVLCRRMTQEK